MMNVEVVNFAKQFCSKPKYVFINEKNIARLAREFPYYKNLLQWGERTNYVVLDQGEKLTKSQTIVFELMANSINYCYWYGYPTVRPCGSSSVKMYELLKRSWKLYSGEFGITAGIVYRLIELMTFYRFPLLSERVKHLEELTQSPGGIERVVSAVNTCDATELLRKVANSFVGFGEDLFLKRAQLFIFALLRRGIEIPGFEKLSVPADYQLPNVLRKLEILKYSRKLKKKVDDFDLIIKGSRMEVELRAATIIACDKLSKASGYNSMEIDNFLWQLRKKVSNTHHCTITTDY